MNWPVALSDMGIAVAASRNRAAKLMEIMVI
jgi:hypothetical protein